MLKLKEDVVLYLYSKAVDMRKSIDGLSYIVSDLLEKNPQDGALYLFLNKSRDKVKLLYWDKNGFVMYYKRLEKVQFKFKKSSDTEVITLEEKQLSWLLAGLDFQLMNDFSELDYTEYY